MITADGCVASNQYKQKNRREITGCMDYRIRTAHDELRSMCCVIIALQQQYECVWYTVPAKITAA